MSGADANNKVRDNQVESIFPKPRRIKSLDASVGACLSNSLVTASVFVRAAPSNQTLLLITMKSLLALALSALLILVTVQSGVTKGQRVPEKFRSGIAGRITDRNGAVIIGARITFVARSSDTSVVRKSNDEGQYVADLEPETYDVVAEASGFKAAKRKSIPVLRESRSYVDFVLDVAEPIVPKRIH